MKDVTMYGGRRPHSANDAPPGQPVNCCSGLDEDAGARHVAALAVCAGLERSNGSGTMTAYALEGVSGAPAGPRRYALRAGVDLFEALSALERQAAGLSALAKGGGAT